MNWILIVLLAIAGFLLIRYWKGLFDALGKMFENSGSTLITLVIVLVVAGLIIILFQPQILVGSLGVFGPALKISRAEANLKSAAIDPRDNPDIWNNQIAQSLAVEVHEAVASEYQLATAKNKAGISAAEADRLSHLPKGHPDRALWDEAGMDPATGSLPPAVQVSKNTVGEIAKNVGDELRKIDLTDREKELSKPLGQAPANADLWLQQIYSTPKGWWVIAGLLLAVAVLGTMVTSLLRVLLRTS